MCAIEPGEASLARPLTARMRTASPCSARMRSTRPEAKVREPAHRRARWLEPARPARLDRSARGTSLGASIRFQVMWVRAFVSLPKNEEALPGAPRVPERGHLGLADAGEGVEAVPRGGRGASARRHALHGVAVLQVVARRPLVERGRPNRIARRARRSDAAAIVSGRRRAPRVARAHSIRAEP